jgi:hypothetical protein
MRTVNALCLLASLAACGSRPSEPVRAPDANATESRLLPATSDPGCARVAMYQPAGGMIPDAEEAKRVAVVYFRRHYPDIDLDGYEIRAQLVNGVFWHVEAAVPADALGGGPNIQMCRSNGSVIRLYATQ